MTSCTGLSIENLAYIMDLLSGIGQFRIIIYGIAIEME